MSGFTVVLEPKVPADKGTYKDTALPFSAGRYRPPAEEVPEPIRKMRRMYGYGREMELSRAGVFYRQAELMRDYEDDVPWSGPFSRYFPTYNDMTVQQLRGYFSWRTQLRKGNYQPIDTSAAYIYIYELLNGIGADSPEDILGRLKDFEQGYLDTGFGDSRMRANLHRWMLEIAVLNGIVSEDVISLADPDMLEKDKALTVLKESESYSDDEVFSALCIFAKKNFAQSPVITNDPARGAHLFSMVWRRISGYRFENKSLFTLCFGRKKTRRWYPLFNAVYYDRSGRNDRDYVLDGCRSYSLRNGSWHVSAYEKLSFDRNRFQGLLHEADARLRHYLKTGRYIKERPEDEWAAPYIDAVILADEKAIAGAAREEIVINLSGIEKIRRDAAGTRDSLLTEEETREEEMTQNPEPEIKMTRSPAPDIEEFMDPLHMQILRMLLKEEDVSEFIKSRRMMPSIVSDGINDALFDEIGDTVVVCEEDRLSLVEEYIGDLEELLGGNINE